MNNKPCYLHNFWWDAWLCCWYGISQFCAETYENKRLTREPKTTEISSTSKTVSLKFRLRNSQHYETVAYCPANQRLTGTMFFELQSSFIFYWSHTTCFIFEEVSVWIIALLSRSTSYVTVLPRALPQFSSVFTLHCFQVPKHQPV